MTAREWQPGDKAYIEVEVTAPDYGEEDVQCSIGADDGYYLPVNALLPVPASGEVEAATEDVIERARKVLEEHRLIGSRCRCGLDPRLDYFRYESHVAEALAAGLLVGGVPGRSEAETGNLRIEGHWLVREVNHHTCGTGPGGHYGAHEPGCGLIPEVDLSTLPGWRGEAEIKAEALREHRRRVVRYMPPGLVDRATVIADLEEWAARVAGTTEAGDDRG